MPILDHITAKVDNGVFTIVVSKLEKGTMHRIEIGRAQSIAITHKGKGTYTTLHLWL